MLSGYTVTVEGQFFVAVGGGKGRGLRRYRFDVKLPTMDSALSIIKNKILDMVLMRKFEDYVTYRTYNIVNVVPFGKATDAKLTVWQMNRNALEKYIRENELPVKSKLYPVLTSLREATEMAEREPDRFLRVQEQTEKDFKLTNALRELNPELYEEADVLDNL